VVLGNGHEKKSCYHGMGTSPSEGSGGKQIIVEQGKHKADEDTQAGVTHCFVNLGSDHPSTIEAIVKGQNEKKGQFPRTITCPNEVNHVSSYTRWPEADVWTSDGRPLHGRRLRPPD
jgi:hypothetical protein